MSVVDVWVTGIEICRNVWVKRIECVSGRNVWVTGIDSITW